MLFTPYISCLLLERMILSGKLAKLFIRAIFTHFVHIFLEFPQTARSWMLLNLSSEFLVNLDEFLKGF